jgi:dihydrofolate reductase
MKPKRRIVMFNRVTADGYFAAPDGNLDWVVPDEEVDAAGAAAISGFDTMLFGRRTYELFEKFWPHALDDPGTARDPHSARRSTELRAMAVWINEASKVVFSRNRETVTWRNSRLIHDLDPTQIEAMKEQSGKDMIVFGSGAVVSQLSEHRLIDEYQFVVNPLLLGGGRSLVCGVSQRAKLDLIEEKRFASGIVLLRYAVAA